MFKFKGNLFYFINIYRWIIGSLSITLTGCKTPKAQICLSEGFTNEFVALTRKWRLCISSHTMLAGQIPPIAPQVMLQAPPQPRRSKRLASKAKRIYKE